MRRVVITGLGTINPLGHTVEETFTNMINGVNGIDIIKYFNPERIKVKIAGEIKNLDFEKYFDKREIKRNDRVNLYGIIAADEAMKHANFNENDFDSWRFGVYVSSGIGGMDTLYEEITVAADKGPSRVSPFFVPKTIVNMTGGLISIKHGLQGPNIPMVTACSASTNAIGEAFRSIKHGYMDLALAGGSEAPISEIGVSAFSSIRALNQTLDINRASTPFDKDRQGFVLAEGSAVLVLEEYEHAKKRGANILAEIVGYGTTADAHHITAPLEDASGITRAINNAISEANIKPEAIDYINAHGTSTPLNDKIETLGIKKALKNHAYNVNISSTKSMTGHALGAAGAIESVTCVKVIETGIIPPTINYQTKDPDCDLNYTPNKAVTKNVNYAMNINIGFGGHNAVLIFKKVGE